MGAEQQVRKAPAPPGSILPVMTYEAPNPTQTRGRRPKLVFFVTEDWYFRSHRLPLAIAAQTAGFDVALITRVREHAEEIRAAGIDVIPIRMARGGKNPIVELGILRTLVDMYRRLKPDIVHHVAFKPALYGSIAARLAKVPNVVNELAGLGYVFSSPQLKARLLRPIIEVMFRVILKKYPVIIHNADDRQLLLERKLFEPSRMTLVRGSGVDTVAFSPTPELPGKPLVVLPARLLWDKGVAEFVAAARLLKQRGVDARFALVGDRDAENPGAVPQAVLNAWDSEGIVELWGWRNNMAAVFRDCHIACLPSYREGLPKALLEAASCGRPLVTCDVPGCREVVRHRVNGLLVPMQNATALAEALEDLIEHPLKRADLGRNAREIVVAEYALDVVNHQKLALYSELLPV
jgi:glycosyltransferase involved in cell wall biosynthesis